MDASAPLPENTPNQKAPPMDGEEPEKRIRTFASDMDAAKRGGAPSATPPPTPPNPAPRPAIPGPAAPPAPKAAPPPRPASFNILARAKNPPQTYSGDFSDRVKEVHASTATILAAEQDAKARTSSTPPPPDSSRKNLLYGIAGILLIMVSAAGGYFAYRQYETTSLPPLPAPKTNAPIFVDEREEVSGSGTELLQAVKSSINRTLAPGTVRLLSTAGSMGTSTVFLALPVSIPDVLVRNIIPAKSMAGVVHAGGNQSPFFILSVSSYSNAFSGMLAWEPLLPGALAELYLPYPAQTAASATTTAATTTQAVKNAPPSVTFVDVTVANHDVRVYRDTSGRDILLYGFWNQETLIIAKDAAAFAEIAIRLSTAPAS